MSFAVPTRSFNAAVQKVTIGATKDEGGTRSHAITVGGGSTMPLMTMDGAVPHKPVVAMEVFDTPPVPFPPPLQPIYGDLLGQPAKMAKKCVEEYGAELISVRLRGAHPDRGDRSPEDCVEVVKSVLESVPVPLIVTGVNHFEKHNQVLRAVAEACAGERLLLNWVETDNYKTLAATALAYGHSLVTLSPVDINMAKQLNILATEIGVPRERIVMDPMMSPLGYGLDYGYTISERIKLTGLTGDQQLSFPILFNVGYECSKIKELTTPMEENRALGPLDERVAVWETVTATALLVAGADILVLYHPEAAMELKSKIQLLSTPCPQEA